METKPSTRTLKSILNDIESGKIVLPYFQREYFWSKEKVLGLLESIKNNYPIGVIYLVENKKNFSYKMSKAQALLSKKNPSPESLLFDGQQRLFSLLSGKEEKSLTIDSIYQKQKISKSGYFYYDTKQNKFIHRVNQVKKKPKNIKNISEIIDFAKYKIPIIYIGNAKQDELYKLFDNINSKNTSLTGWDLFIAERFSISEKQALDLIDLSEQISIGTSLGKSLNEHDFKTLLSVLIMTKDRKVNNLLKAKNQATIKRVISKSKKVVELFGQVLDLLLFKDYFDDPLLKNYNALEYLLEKIENRAKLNEMTDKEILNLFFVEFFLQNILKFNYDNISELKENIKIKEIKSTLKKQSNDSSTDARDPAMRLLRAYMTERKTVDGIFHDNKIKPLKEFENKNLEIEHIFPKNPSNAYLKQVNKSDYKENIESIGNKTIVSKECNIEWGNKLPKEKITLTRNSFEHDNSKLKIFAISHFFSAELFQYFETIGIKDFSKAIEKREDDIISVLLLYLQKKILSMGQNNS